MTWGVSCIENDIHGTSLMVQWLRRQASNSRGSGLIPDGAIKILHARRPKQTNKQTTHSVVVRGTGEVCDDTEVGERKRKMIYDRKCQGEYEKGGDSRGARGEGLPGGGNTIQRRSKKCSGILIPQFLNRLNCTEKKEL